MPVENLATANIETIKPTAELLTPKDFAKSGIAGTMMPKPTATKNAAAVRTLTSRGNPESTLNRLNQ